MWTRFTRWYENTPILQKLLLKSSEVFVERIDVYKPEMVPGTRTKKQTTCIHWNFIGAVDTPAEHEKTA